MTYALGSFATMKLDLLKRMEIRWRNEAPMVGLAYPNVCACNKYARIIPPPLFHTTQFGYSLVVATAGEGQRAKHHQLKKEEHTLDQHCESNKVLASSWILGDQISRDPTGYLK